MRFYAFIFAFLLLTAPALATPPEVDELTDLTSAYISISANGASTVTVEDGVTVISAAADNSFDLDVDACYSSEVDTCWIYFNGDVIESSYMAITPTDFRIHYGAVAILYADNSMDYASFAVYPYFDDINDITFSASAPVASFWGLLPLDVTSVFTDVIGIEPAGPATASWKGMCVVIGVNGDCDQVLTERDAECTTDSQCRNYK